ncbi:MAG: hypothetical protein BWK76_27490 [Desulfobulbaceae bacterium A2]|nr:MAG: hypothetical protein BWK76_27490 [Desulfobulbaceae bacterium A2]
MKQWLYTYPSIDDLYRLLENPETIPEIISRAERTLFDLHSEEIPNAAFPFSMLILLIEELIRTQRAPGSFLVWGGSWALLHPDESAPADARVDWIFFPSYIVVSILSLFWFRFPDEATKLPNFEESLWNGLHFISARKLLGHGYDAEEDRVKAVKILILGKVPQYLRENAHRSEKLQPLHDVLMSFRDEMERELFSQGATFQMFKALS